MGIPDLLQSRHICKEQEINYKTPNNYQQTVTLHKGPYTEGLMRNMNKTNQQEVRTNKVFLQDKYLSFCSIINVH